MTRTRPDPGRTTGRLCEWSAPRWLVAGALTAVLLAAVGCAEPAPAPRRVILVGVDTLRADHLGLYGARRPTSPFLDELAAEGRVFDRAFATSPWTLPSFASMFTGRLQSGHAAGIPLRNSDEDWHEERVGPQRLVMLDADVETLAARVQAAGIRTGAIVQNPFLSPAFGVDRGFDDYDYYRGDHRDTRRADVVVDRALAWIDGIGDGAFFLFVHLFDPHMEYDAPKPVRGMFTDELPGGFTLPVTGDPRKLNRNAAAIPPERREFIAAAYDEEIRFVDDQLRRLVAGLRARGLWEGSLVMLTSDHGEELFDHDGFEHGHTLYDELIRVPLVVWGPGVSPGRSDGAVSIADVAPTVLDALSLPPLGAIFGSSLWPHLVAARPLPRRFLAAEGVLYGAEEKAGIQWPHKIIVNTKTERARLFDLQADPGESHQIGTEGELEAELRQQLELRLLASSRGVTMQATEMDPELQERLRALGYIQ